MPQKLDLTPVNDDDEKLDLTPVVEDSPKLPAADPNFLSSIYHKLSDPLTDLPSQFGRYLSKGMDSVPTMQMRGDNSWHDTLAKFDNQSKGFFQGATEATGDVASGLTSPANLGMLAATGGSNIAGKAGLESLAELLSLGGKGLAIPGMVHGGSEVVNPESTMQQRGQGLVELAGNAAGFSHTPSTKISSLTESIPKQIENPLLAEHFARERARTPTVESGIDPIDPNFFSHIKPEIARPEVPAEFQPTDVTGQESTGLQGKSSEQLTYDLGRENFNMGRDWPSDTPPHIAESTSEAPLANEGRREFVSLGDEQTGRSNDSTPSKPTLENAPLGQSVLIRKQNASPNIIKEVKAAGFKFDGIDEKGNFKFKKVTEPNIQPILEEEVGENRPNPSGIKEQLGPVTDQRRGSNVVEAFNLPRGIMAAGDLSAPLRQGIGLIHKKEFWTSIKPMFEAWMTEDGFRNSQQAIAERPLFRERAGVGGKILPSFADDAGLKLTDLTDLSSREEAIMSTWAEKVPGVRRSNRAYTAFLNNLRADTFESLVKDGKVFGSDAKVNLPLARELANFVNTASGRGSLGSLEKSAVALNTVFFSPRLIASRLQMMNPAYYIMASPMVRKEALKSLFAVAAAGNVVTQLGKMAGGSVSADPTSTDFGKLKIGNTRIDPFGGYQQYIVAASRLISGKVTSSTTGNEYDLNDPQGPYDPTHADIATRFVRGKVHPVIGFAWSLMSGKKEMSGEPMNFSTPNPMENAVAQRFIPILWQDFYELAKDPDMSPLLKGLVGAGATFGMGQQTYGSVAQ